MLRQPARFATLLSLGLLLTLPLAALGQEDKPLDFERDFGLSNLPDLGGPQFGAVDVVFSAFIIPPRDGAPPQLAVQADVAQGFHIYSLTQPANGPLRTEIAVDKSPQFSLAAPFQPNKAPEVTHKEEYFPGVPIEEHRGIVTWLAPLRLAADADLQTLAIAGRIEGQLCTDNLGTCRTFDLLGEGADRFTATLATDEDLASLKTIRTIPIDTASDAPAFVGQFAARDNNPIIRGHIEPKIVAPGGTAKLVLSIEPHAGWHLYLREDKVPPAGSRPTLIVLTNTSGLAPHAPATDTKVVVKPEQQYYDGAPTWTVEIPIPQGASPGDYKIEGHLAYQVCSESTCHAPSAVTFRGVIAVGSQVAAGQTPLGFDEGDYAAAMQALATRVAWAGAAGGSPGVIDYAAIQEQARAERDAKPMIFWIGAAILAGFILNFMPCVLPVIGLKVMSFVQQAGEDRKQIFLLNLVYALGMLSVFWVLATLAAFANFTWSDQFGSVAFNVSLAAVVFLFALSFLGVWEVPIPGFVGSGSASSMAEREGLGGAFAKGILTTLLATPCTGPMLGPALGWAVGKPPLFSYLIFTCVGLGMALPYLIIGAQPRLVKFLPRPGAWMETFKNIMGFVLMATLIFILSYLPIEYVVPTITFCIGLWAACWWIGRKQSEGLDTQKMILNWAGSATFVVIVGMFSFMWLSDVMRARLEKLVTDRISDAFEQSGDAQANAATPATRIEKSPHELPWENFSQEALEKHIAQGRTVFVDFTADWCVVCKRNERKSLNTEPVRQLVDEHGIVTLKADLTARPPELVEMMRRLGHPSGALPFYAVFPADRPNDAVFFEGWQTQSYFLEQLRSAGPSHSPSTRTAMMPTP